MNAQSIFSLLPAIVAMSDLLQTATAQSGTREEAIEIAESFVNHRWTASAETARHGRYRGFGD